jgi:hypothetical protein
MDKDFDISLIACHKSRDTCFLLCVSQWSGRGHVMNRVFDSSFVKAIKTKLGILARGWRTSLMGMCVYSFHGPPSVRFPLTHACMHALQVRRSCFDSLNLCCIIALYRDVIYVLAVVMYVHAMPCHATILLWTVLPFVRARKRCERSLPF